MFNYYWLDIDIGKDEVQSPNLTVGFHRSRDMLSHSLQRLIVIISDPSMHNLVAHLSALCVFGIIDSNSNIFLISLSISQTGTFI